MSSENDDIWENVEAELISISHGTDCTDYRPLCGFNYGLVTSYINTFLAVGDCTKEFIHSMHTASISDALLPYRYKNTDISLEMLTWKPLNNALNGI